MTAEAEPRVVVSSVEGAALTQSIEARSHTWLSDEPTGTGDDRGPTPYEMLLAALGSCTSMTVAMYAKMKTIPLESVRVTLTYNRIHEKDCEDADAPGRRVHRMTRNIELGGLLTAEQRERLVQIAERCPVHRTLTEEIHGGDRHRDDTWRLTGHNCQMGTGMGSRRRTLVSIVLALAFTATWLEPARGAAPSIKLIGSYDHITVKRLSRDQPAFVPLGAWIASVGGAFELRATKDPSDYALPIEVTQVDAEAPDDPPIVTLPSGSANPNWRGLFDFLDLDVQKPNGNFQEPRSFDWCPSEGARERTSDAGPIESVYLDFCDGGPFTRGVVWGIDEGWATRALAGGVVPIFGKDGDYNLTLSIAEPYRTVFGVAGGDESISLLVHVKSTSTAQKSAATTADSGPASAAAATSPPDCDPPCVPDADTLPDLVAFPAWNIRPYRLDGRNYLSFAATEWNEGPAPLIVEGFRISGQAKMDAYQYFYRDGQPVARSHVGQLVYHRGGGHDHWHFKQFAEYTLWQGSTLKATSGKESWCLAPTDAIDLTIDGASWSPGDGNLTTACGSRESQWVREKLAVGWGDTYYQSVTGQSLDITALPDGDYTMRIEVNPETSPGVRPLFESDTSNNLQERVIHLSTVPGSKKRSVTVEPWNGVTD
jgi:uncharacterized OsmC-like protein